MIRTETLPGGLVRTWSDAGLLLCQTDTGVEYVEAVDVAGSPHAYVETSTAAAEWEEGGAADD